jgi:protein-disulfide isomerase
MPKKTTPKRTVAKKAPVAESVQAPPAPNYSRGPSNLLIVFLIAVSFFAGYLFYKVKHLEQLAQNPGAVQNAGSEKLSVENLKKYAKDIKLDTNKFNTCLDKSEGKAVVEADMKEAGGLGIQGTPGFLVNGRFLGGAFPFEMFKEIIDKELDGTATGKCTDYSTQLQEVCDETGNDSFNPVPKEVSPGDAEPQGPANARVTIIEYSDFECPFCQRAFPTVEQIIETYPNDVKFYYKHLPLNNIHPKAQKAAEAAVCADMQGKFWEYHDKLFQEASAA